MRHRGRHRDDEDGVREVTIPRKAQAVGKKIAVK